MKILDVAPSCPMISFKKVQTLIVTSSGKRRDSFEMTVSPSPLTALSDLALNLTFSYTVSIYDFIVSLSIWRHWSGISQIYLSVGNFSIFLFFLYNYRVFCIYYFFFPLFIVFISSGLLTPSPPNEQEMSSKSRIHFAETWLIKLSY